MMLLFYAFMSGVFREAFRPRKVAERQANGHRLADPLLSTETSSEAVEADTQQQPAESEHFGAPEDTAQPEPPPVEVSSEVAEPQQPADLEHFGMAEEPEQRESSPQVEVSSEVVEEDAWQQPGEIEDFGAREEPVRRGHTSLADVYSAIVEEEPEPAEVDPFGVPEKLELEGLAADETEPRQIADVRKMPPQKPGPEGAFSPGKAWRTFSATPDPETSPKDDERSCTIVGPQDVESQDAGAVDVPEDGDEEEPETSIEERPKRPPQVA